MTAAIDTAKLDIFGDDLTVEWNGGVWIAPTTGSQHATARDAMRIELHRYLVASGEDVDYDDNEHLTDGWEEKLDDID